MSIRYLNLAFDAEIKPSSLKFVLVALCDYASEDGLAWPTVQTLARKTGQDRKTVLINLKRLHYLGFVEDTFERRGRTKKVTVWQLKLTEKRYEKSPDCEGGQGENFDPNRVEKIALKADRKECVNEAGNGTESGTVLDAVAVPKTG